MIIPEIEIVSEKTLEEQILDLITKHKELAGYQIISALDLPWSTFKSAMDRIERKHLVSTRKVVIKVNGVRRNAKMYRLK